jgi:hypothetical protein
MWGQPHTAARPSEARPPEAQAERGQATKSELRTSELKTNKIDNFFPEGKEQLGMWTRVAWGSSVLNNAPTASKHFLSRRSSHGVSLNPDRLAPEYFLESNSQPLLCVGNPLCDSPSPFPTSCLRPTTTADRVAHGSYLRLGHHQAQRLARSGTSLSSHRTSS